MWGSGTRGAFLLGVLLSLVAVTQCALDKEAECVMCLATAGLVHAVHNVPSDMARPDLVPNPMPLGLHGLCQEVSKVLQQLGGTECPSHPSPFYTGILAKLKPAAEYNPKAAEIRVKFGKEQLPGPSEVCRAFCDAHDANVCGMQICQQRLDVLRANARAVVHTRLLQALVGTDDTREVFVRALTEVPAPHDVFDTMTNVSRAIAEAQRARPQADTLPLLKEDHSSAANLPFRSALRVVDVTATDVQSAVRAVLHSQRNVFDNKGAAVLVDLRAVVTRMMLWGKQLPHVRPYFAIKSNPHPLVVQGLLETAKLAGYPDGMGVDCASQEEFRVAMDRHGVPAQRIIYAHTLKPLDSMYEAYTRGITRMTFDTEAELLKVVALRQLLVRRKEFKQDFELVLRFVVENEGCTCRLGDKFGATFNESIALLAFAKAHKLNVMGLAFHVGSGGINLGVFSIALATANSLFDAAHTQGFNLKLLDMGGGWPGVDPVDPRFPTFAELAGLIRDQLKFNGFTDETGKPREGLTIIAEPGRFFSTQSTHLAVKVIARRPWFLHDEAGKMQSDDTHRVVTELRHAGILLKPEEHQAEADKEKRLGEPAGYKYTIADGTYKALSSVLLDNAKPEVFVLETAIENAYVIDGTNVIMGDPEAHLTRMESLSRVDKKRLFHSVVFGETCDSIDFPVPFERVLMLPRLPIGSWLFIPNVGAYNFNVWTSFNGFRDPAIIPIAIASPSLKATSLPQRSTVLPTDRGRRLLADAEPWMTMGRKCDLQPTTAEWLPLPVSAAGKLHNADISNFHTIWDYIYASGKITEFVDPKREKIATLTSLGKSNSAVNLVTGLAPFRSASVKLHGTRQPKPGKLESNLVPSKLPFKKTNL